MREAKIDVFRFETNNGNGYIFDNASGMVFPCNDAMYYVVSNIFEKSKEEIKENLIEHFGINELESDKIYIHIEGLVSNGYLYRNKEQHTFVALTEQDIIQTQLSQLILIVTENCNIRCKYCIYSDNYPHVKGYSNKRMSLETAKKAVDYYMELHQKRIDSGFRRKPIITFYGGEPLLEFELMQQIVNYCKEKKYVPRYFVTTNATLLNDEMINFIIDNEIIVTFSLDGFKENNDRNRTFSNSKGTFDVILDNVIKLQNEKKKRKIVQAISFSCCFDTYTDMCKVVDFFDQHHQLFYPYNIIYNEIGKYNTTYYESCDIAYKEGKIKESPETLENTINILQKEFLNYAVNGEQLDKVGLLYLFMGIVNIVWRSKGRIPENKLACTPGSKIAVSPDGEFYVCEKVSQICSIGNVDLGIDLNQVNELNNKYLKIRNEHCKECTISRLCPVCFMHLAKDETLEFNAEMCMNNKKSIPNMLKMVFSVLEKNPNAFDLLSPDDPKKVLYEI